VYPSLPICIATINNIPFSSSALLALLTSNFTSPHNHRNSRGNHSCQAYFQRPQDLKHSHRRECSEDAASRCETSVSIGLEGCGQSTCCVRMSLASKENQYENDDILMSPAKKVLPAPMSIGLKSNVNNSRSTTVKVIHHAMISANTSASLVGQRSFCPIHSSGSCSRGCLSHSKTLLP